MSKKPFPEDFYFNDFHRRNSDGAQHEIEEMKKHPNSREQKLEKIP